MALHFYVLASLNLGQNTRRVIFSASFIFQLSN